MKSLLLKVASVIAVSSLLFGCMHTEPTASPTRATQGPHEFKWVLVPLRTAAQKARGYTGGETGQMAYSMAISSQDPDYLAIAIDTAPVYLSRNGARSWEPKRNGIMSDGVQSIAFDPRNHNVLWAAGTRSDPEGGAADPAADGIYRTSDCGENWKLVRNAFYVRRQAQNEYFAFDALSFDGTQCRTIYAATHKEGVLKTTDAGKTWRILGFQNQVVNAVALHPMNNRLLFVASDTGLYRSNDAGESFERIGGGLPPTAAVPGFVANPRDPNVLYVALGEEGIWRSADGGKSFARAMNGIPEFYSRKLWLRLCISPADPRRLYADARWGGMFPYWSADGGKSWNAPLKREAAFIDMDPSNTNHWEPEGFIAHPTDPNVAYDITPVRKTTDGGRTWTYASDGLSGCVRDFRTSVAFHPTDPGTMMFFHIDWGSAHTVDGGDTFTYCPPPRQSQFAFGAMTTPVGAYDPTPGSHKLISAVGGWFKQLICTSENDGRSWNVQQGTEGDYRFLAFHPQKPKVVYAGRATDSLRSRDGGETWTVLPYLIRAVFPGNGDIVFAGRPNDPKRWEWTMMRSSDQGDTWQPLPGSLWGEFYDVDVHPTNPDRLYAATWNGVWVFDGTGWTIRDEHNGLERNSFGDLVFQSIAVDPTHPEVIYAGQNESWRGVARGIFRSTDGGSSWKNINLNLGHDLTVRGIAVSPHDGTVWLGTDYGNWKLPSGPYDE